MSTKNNKKNTVLTETGYPDRIDALIKTLKASGIDTEKYSGLDRSSKFNYKNGRIPQGDTLHLLSKEFDVNLHWLLLNEGPMFRKEMREAMKRGEEAEERVQELKYTLGLQREKIEQLEKRQDAFLTTAAPGAGNAAPSSLPDTE